MKIQNISGVLLAGGKSRRMGKDKRLLQLQGQTLFERSLDVLREVFSEVLVVLGNDHFAVNAPDVRIVYDIIPNRATAGGLYTGLYYSTNPMVFVVACDMPFLNAQVIRFLTTIALDYDITLVELVQGIQPTHAMYSKRCLPFLEEMVKKEDLRIQNLFMEPSLKIRRVQESEIHCYDNYLLSFMNVNSPADFELARKLAISSST